MTVEFLASEVGKKTTENQEFVFCATGKSGLGHLRRITNVGRAISRLAPAVQLHLISNAPVAGLCVEEIDLFRSITVVGREEMAAHANTLPHGPIVVDTAVIPDLHSIDRPLCLILRETMPGRLAAFHLRKHRKWDLVCIPNPAHHWRPEKTEIGAQRVKAVGWIYRPPKQNITHSQNRSGSRTILIASGGGGNQVTSNYLSSQINPVLQSVRAQCGIAVHVTQVIGPRAPPEAILPHVDELLDAGPQLNEAFGLYDLVISTAGYNSVLELACIDTPVLLVPIPRSLDDQTARAKKWSGKLGCVHICDQHELSADWILGVLATGRRRKPVNLGASGADLCARMLMDLVQ